MVDNKDVYITQQGLTRLEEELEFLRTVRRKEVAERIIQAKEYGDITDNSEYEEAKNEQAFVEGRIMEIEKILRVAKVLEYKDVISDSITIGSRVVLKSLDSKNEEEYVIVGNVEEVDPRRGYISANSPLGLAVINKKPGDQVYFDAPIGRLNYVVLEIKKGLDGRETTEA
ncbi:MAG: Transcription elongation factor GreA [candidate division WS2 bacterium]|uniref:Transcription elongation factor GreA n=1 Tax=Psychracetigena formicireducens TaxID=2986056 RepID=A0A9E2F6A4_PSYF1|nr:Transcription elongation factor GreA [Candidatus Psychracetigena formicireducens]MBT9144388.1 Transcription elongation factor GreA [Candidatus Psychracetigena formicireducens]MBT9149900.1 Transcription elongation factor GreA [Candidatus Psychracetigena formicireducens]